MSLNFTFSPMELGFLISILKKVKGYTISEVELSSSKIRLVAWNYNDIQQLQKLLEYHWLNKIK